jgi:catechol-2,3-dioxygenase
MAASLGQTGSRLAEWAIGRIKHSAYTLAALHRTTQWGRAFEGRIKISGLGHVALKVIDIGCSKQFNHGILGMPYSGEHEGKSMVFFRSDEHHNLALFQVDSLDNSSPSLDHIGF